MINCMYVYMYVFWYLILSSLVGKSYLSAQGLLYNYVVGTSSNSQEALADDIQSTRHKDIEPHSD